MVALICRTFGALRRAAWSLIRAGGAAAITETAYVFTQQSRYVRQGLPAVAMGIGATLKSVLIVANRQIFLENSAV